MQARAARISKVLWQILFLNVFVAGAKTAWGIVSGSTAMLTDGIHTFTDGAGNVVALIAMKAARIPPDANHPYGHHKYEPFASAAIGIVLCLATVLSDGAVVFQPRKIQCSGIWYVVAGRVLITWHKERRVELVQRRFPAGHYVMIDDKPQLLAAMKRLLGARLTTVFVRQGHYAAESGNNSIDPVPDMTVGYIGDLCALA